MRRYFVLLLVAVMASFCRPARPQQPGPWVLHVWIYGNRDYHEVQRVVDSSHCRYTIFMEKQNDGTTRVEFRFRPDPSFRQMGKLFGRLNRYPGKQGFTTTRGKKENEL